MRRTIPIGDLPARPLLLRAGDTTLGPAKQTGTGRMLINSLSCSVLGVLVMVLAT